MHGGESPQPNGQYGGDDQRDDAISERSVKYRFTATRTFWRSFGNCLPSNRSTGPKVISNR